MSVALSTTDTAAQCATVSMSVVLCGAVSVLSSCWSAAVYCSLFDHNTENETGLSSHDDQGIDGEKMVC